MVQHERDSHCGFCGSSFEGAEWQHNARRCPACGNETFRNAKIIVVLLVPTTDGGLLLIQRGIEPLKGAWALVGGYKEYGERWQLSGSREHRQETKIRVNAKDIEHFATLDAFGGTLTIICGLLKKPVDASKFRPTEEATACRVIYKPIRMPGLPHNEILVRRYFTQR